VRDLISRQGRLPEALRTRVYGEGVLLCEEQLPGRLVLSGYRGPGVATTGRRNSVWATICITQRGLLVWLSPLRRPRSWPRRLIDVPHGHQLSELIAVRSPSPDRVTFDFDGTAMGPGHSGHVHLTLHTEQAPQVIRLLWGQGWRG